MGIKQLTKLLTENAVHCMKEQTVKDYTGRKLAIDASMAIYQFLVAVRSGGEGHGPSQQLTNEAGEVTSHLQGLWYRTLKFLEAGIKPVYVFDGKPPTLKGGELAKRKAAKEKAIADLAAAQEAGNEEDIERFSKRTVRMTPEYVEDCKKLLRLMGMPVVEAPCEAEAQCAALAKSGKVYAAVSEDMDTLTFGAPRLVRRLWASEASKAPITEIALDKALGGLGVTMEQFVDMCILSGCDYCDTIKGVAATTAHKLVKQHGSIEGVLASIEDKSRIPEVDWAEVRALFVTPEVADPETLDIKWVDCNEEGLLQFLVTEKGFQKDRIETGITRLKKSKSAGQQLRMDSFFASAPAAAGGGGSSSSGGGGGGGVKRKADDKAGGGKGGKTAKTESKGSLKKK